MTALCRDISAPRDPTKDAVLQGVAPTIGIGHRMTRCERRCNIETLHAASGAGEDWPGPRERQGVRCSVADLEGVTGPESVGKTCSCDPRTGGVETACRVVSLGTADAVFASPRQLALQAVHPRDGSSGERRESLSIWHWLGRARVRPPRSASRGRWLPDIRSFEPPAESMTAMSGIYPGA